MGSTLVGRWRLEKLLGSGGMASVYSATHRNGKRVAIKMLHGDLLSDDTLRQRFLQEAYAANAIDHPAVVEVDDDQIDEQGTPFLVMELVYGRTLEEERKRQGGKINTPNAISIVAELLHVLAWAHQRGVLHRDLKPENLMLSNDGPLRVLDFGLARATERDGDSALTQPGSILGTPHFMAPEQALGRWASVDETTDLWAAGAILFRILTARFVHDGDTMQEVLALAGTAHAKPLSTVLPSAPTELCRFVDRALTYAKADRFDGARQMFAALRGDVAKPLGFELPRPEPTPRTTDIDDDGDDDASQTDSPDTFATSATLVSPHNLSPPASDSRKVVWKGFFLVGVVAIGATIFIFPWLRGLNEREPTAMPAVTLPETSPVTESAATTPLATPSASSSRPSAATTAQTSASTTIHPTPIGRLKNEHARKPPAEPQADPSPGTTTSAPQAIRNPLDLRK